MHFPLISCITPTTAVRNKFLPLLLDSFLHQNYPNKEMVVVSEDDIPLPNDPRIRFVKIDGFKTIGAKRNIACQHARGEFIAHFDSDDYSGPQRLTDVFSLITNTGKPFQGYNTILHYDLDTRAFFHRKPIEWAYGMTMAYCKSFWESHNFVDIQKGEDVEFGLYAFAQNQVVLAQGHDKLVTIDHINNVYPRGVSGTYGPTTNRITVQFEQAVPGFLPALTKCGMSEYPLISCITPTVAARNNFLPLLLKSYLSQEYPSKELVIVSEDAIPLPIRPDIRLIKINHFETIGAKRNIACRNAKGEIITHFDSDDYSGPSRLSDMLSLIRLSGKSVVGYRGPTHYDTRNQKAFHRNNNWLEGLTLTYLKNFWENHFFINEQTGEDTEFTQHALAINEAAWMMGHSKMVTLNHDQNTVKRWESDYMLDHVTTVSLNEGYMREFLSVLGRCPAG